ncbi:MAG TPA: nodulation protein NfeD [Candidatus Desulfofervidus auxilii]|uniref:Nodulation protein NfeD n=1 Tax=Desulfofervidus auxilii TaxID=1621989 RepID=A0A7C0Y3J8_DESA2|nr:nodulation protein NfeD [Candidatus Desulfofervidus auxilii]
MKKYIILTVFIILIFPASVLTKEVYFLEIEEIISPAVVELILSTLEKAKTHKPECVIIQLDTPGGLANSMYKIVKIILNSPIPVVVYVAPSGARAASAGAIITIAAHIAAMAPGTNIGAAHPVNLGGKTSKEMTEKIVNDMVAYVKSIALKRNRNAKIAEKMVKKSISLTAKEALKVNIVDIVADSFSELLEKINGKKVSTVLGKKIIKTKDCNVIEIKGGIRYEILRILSNPNIAYLLMMIGLAGLYFELAHPGVVLPGVIGAISLVLAFFAFQVLPVNYAGVLLILLGIIFFILELKITSYGLLTIAAIFCYALGSLMLFHEAPGYFHISWSVLWPTLLFISLFFIGVMGLVVKAQRARVKIGKESLIGEIGEVVEAISPGSLGKVFVHGEYWNAESEEHISKKEKVKIIDVKGLKLKVKKIKNGGSYV